MASIQSEDITGRDRILSNVLTSWGAYFILVVTGFIIPRMIDRYIGQFSLGIWDFCWSFVNYLSLVDFGAGSCVNRYVAMHRASGDEDALRKSVSSVVLIQVVMAFGILAGAAAVAWLMPFLFKGRLGAEMEASRQVVAILGVGLAFQKLMTPFRGVITGCHRWDINNGLNAFQRLLAAAMMIVSLYLGGGLVQLAIAFMFTTIVSEYARMIYAYKVCQNLKVRIEYVEWANSKKLLMFGMKTTITSIPEFIVIQTTNIIVAALIGPMALAVFSRPIALVNYIGTMVNRFAFVLTPTAGAMHGIGETKELRSFMLETTKYGIAMTFPMLAALAIYGDIILTFWMGPAYGNAEVVAILAAGHLVPISQSPALRILVGMNAHGRAALLSLAAAIIVYSLAFIVALSYEVNLTAMAILVALALTFGKGLAIVAQVCKVFKITVAEYVLQTFTVPVLCSLPYITCLLASRIILPESGIISMLYGATLGSSVLCALYYKFLVPRDVIDRFTNKIIAGSGSALRMARAEAAEHEHS